VINNRYGDSKLVANSTHADVGSFGFQFYHSYSSIADAGKLG